VADRSDAQAATGAVTIIGTGNFTFRISVAGVVKENITRGQWTFYVSGWQPSDLTRSQRRNERCLPRLMAGIRTSPGSSLYHKVALGGAKRDYDRLRAGIFNALSVSQILGIVVRIHKFD